MYFKKFQVGDKVSYCGEKNRDLAGQLGVIFARVEGTSNEVVVDFGNGTYILDENLHLTKFQGKEAPRRETKEEKAEKKAAGVDVQKRKGVGKRSNQEDEE